MQSMRIEVNNRIVALIGRPNVGKSALFNRLTERRISIVEGEPGVTRDRIYAECEWTGVSFTLVDTGGVEHVPSHLYSELIKEQAERAIAEAGLLLFVVDSRTGLSHADEEIAVLLRRSGKPVIVVANKADDDALARSSVEFYEFGLGSPIPVSAEHGRGIGDLLDTIVGCLPREETVEVHEEQINVAIVGRPNVGKSSLVNRLSGEERSIVSDTPGTTRDAIDTHINHEGNQFVLIDTAGIRRKSRIDHDVERYSVARSFNAVDRADVCFVLLDATELVTEQDQRIAGYAHRAGKAIVLVVNKWDLVEKDDKTMNKFERDIRQAYKFLQYAPILFISATEGQRVRDLFDLAVYVAEQRSMSITTGQLNKTLQEAMSRRQPPSDKGERLRVYYATQSGIKPPGFTLFVNDPKLMHYSYERYIENALRNSFGFVGTPIIIRLRRRSRGLER